MDQQQEIGSSSTSCGCGEDSSSPSCPQTVTILLDGVFDFDDYLKHHIPKYKELYPHINIELKRVDGDFRTLENELIEGSAASTSWDGSIFPAQLTGSLVEANALWDWTEYINNIESGTSTNSGDSGNSRTKTMEWTDMLPFFRNEVAVYNNKVRVLPLDGDLLLMYYRKDLLKQHGLSVPRTWDEYTEVAQYFHGQPIGPNNTTMFGSCISRTDHCGNPYWTSLVLSSMTQSMGTSSGFLMDPSTGSSPTTSSSTTSQDQDFTAEQQGGNALRDFESDTKKNGDNDKSDPLLLGPAMIETLRYSAEQVLYGHPEELTGSCLAPNYDFNQGNCALTINWGNQITGLLSNAVDDGAPWEVGVAPTPGSQRILDRSTKTLVNCTATTCPFGVVYPDLGHVNVAPYAAFGGWAAGVNQKAPLSKRHAAAHFLSYLSNSAQSLGDVLPNNRSSFAQPYRYSHVQTFNWVEGGDASVSQTDLISDYTRATRHGFVDSKNTVLELRIPEASDVREILDDEVHLYLSAYEAFGRNLTDQHRIEVTHQMEERIRTVLELDELREVQQQQRRFQRPQQYDRDVESLGVLERYQQSLNVFPVPPDPNYIESDLRMAGWGLGGMICFGALILFFWTMWYRNHRVIVASQKHILIQSSVGLFFLGLTIPLLSLDESLGLGHEILDYTCMVIPWCYCLGFTILFSAIYAKIRQCKKVYQEPGKHNNVLKVPKNASLKLCFRLLMVNFSILFIWQTVDPLHWQRLEMPGSLHLSEEDGIGNARIVLPDTYGTCRGDGIGYIGFAALLWLANQTMLIVAILQAFKCRFLTVEFHEMQWMPVALIPFVEGWVVGSPMLFLVQTQPTGIFVVLTMVIALSTMTAMLAIFAPKEWYIRRDYHDMKRKAKRQRPYPVGVVVLSHPDVVDSREIERLQIMLDSFKSSNMEIEQEIFATKVKVNQMAAMEAKLAAATPERADSRPRLLPAGSSRAELEKNMDEIRSKCDEILSMADDDFSDSDFSDLPDEALKLEVEGNPDFSETSLSERGPDSWRAPSIEPQDSWREPGEHGPDSWRAPSVSENNPEDGDTDSYGYGVAAASAAGFLVDSLAKTPDSSLAVYEDQPVLEARSLPGSDLESGAGSPNRFLAPEPNNDQANSFPVEPMPVFKETSLQQAPSTHADSRGLAAVASMESTEPVFADDSIDMPSTVGAASASVGISTMMSLTMDDDSSADSDNGAKKVSPVETKNLLLVPSPSRTAETQQTQSPSTTASKEDMDNARLEANLDPSASDVSSVETGNNSDSWDPDSTDELIEEALDPENASPNSGDRTKPKSQNIFASPRAPRASNGIVEKKEYSMLDSALETDDLNAIELNASKLAESLKSRLNNTTLTDLRSEPPPFGEDLSLKISASFDTDGTESMADIILNTLLQPDLESFINLSDDTPAEEAPLVVDATSEGSSDTGRQSPADSNGMLVTPSAGESSGVSLRNTIFSSTPVVRDSENGNGSHTQKAGEPSRGDLPKSDLNGFASGYHGKIEAILRGNGVGRTQDAFEARRGTNPVTANGESYTPIVSRGGAMEGHNVKSEESPKSPWSPPEDLNLRMPNDKESASPVRPKLWSPPNDLSSSFDVGDWAAVGVTASALADDTDSVSTSSRTDSVVSVSSVDATQSASALDTPFAAELDKLVGTVDWDGVKRAAVRFESTSGEDAGHTSLDEARRRKREIEAWRSSISESFSKNPEYN